MRHSLLWAVLGACVLIAAVAGYRFGLLGENTETALPVVMTRPIHELVLNDLNARPRQLGQWRGKILVINYWATWCHPCREEMPGFSRLYEKFLGNGVQFVGISIDDASKITEFQKETPVSYPLLIGDMDVMTGSAELGNKHLALPFTAVFDREGKLAATRLGRWAEPDLERTLTKLISR